MPKTYAELIEELQENIRDNPEVANQTVTIYDSQRNEFFPLKDTQVYVGTDVLDDGHFYLEIEG